MSIAPNATVPDEVFQSGSDVIAECELAFGSFIGVVAQAQAEAGLPDAERAADATLLWAALHGYIVLRATTLTFRGLTRTILQWKGLSIAYAVSKPRSTESHG